MERLNNIIALAIHDLNRVDGSYSVDRSDVLLPISNTAERVINTIYDLYNRRTAKSHGRFTTASPCSTENHITEYMTSADQDFMLLTTSMMETLAEEAGKKAASEGGHVFFAHFQRDDNDYLLVTIITDTLSAALTRGGMTDVETLDLAGFRFAGRINLTGWINNQERYLSFLNGKGTLSDYFRDFLGCDSAVLERKDTLSLVSALHDFTVSEGMSESDSTKFLLEAKDYLSKANKAKEQVDFDAIANRLMPSEPSRLSAYLADTERQLNSGYVPNASAIKKLVHLSAENPKMWTVDFSREAVDKSIVRFDAQANTLTLFEVPSELVDQMRSQGMIRD